MKYHFYFFILMLFLGNMAVAQELELAVNVQVQTSTTADPSLFRDLEKNILDFMNTTKWTEDEFRDYEKIKGSLQITITGSPSPNIFMGEFIIQTERPVFNSTYTSPMINIIDKHISFSFTGINPLLKTTNTFYDNLSSLLSYYAYYIIGTDYDSFAINGGDLYFNKALEIIQALPVNYISDDGWSNRGGSKRNRYWYVENVLNPRMRQYRQAFYEYHRLALDKMFDDPDKSRAVLLSALTSMGQCNIEYPNTGLLQSFTDAKKDEILEIFKAGDRGQKTKVTAIIAGIDPSKKSKFGDLE